jgi:hypothetical protein
LKSAAAQVPEFADVDTILGKAAIVRTIYEGRDITPTWERLMASLSLDPANAGAFMDLSIILHTLGKKDEAVTTQTAALDISRNYRISNGQGTGLNVLVIVTAGDFMANTPIEFLLESTDTNILLHYVDVETRDLHGAPAHDVAFVAVGESPENRPVLENLERLLADWSGPIINNAPRRIIDLSREGVSDAFKHEPSILAPQTTRIAREELEGLAAGTTAIDAIGGVACFPVIVRPIGTHAGHGMEKIISPEALATYLGERSEIEFYIAPFIDYSSEDGKFRKQRIAVINGRPYASHLAISDHWMVHYLSAGMAQHGERRAEEASWMANFEADFAVRHARAFDALHRRIGLDYFAIDCAELSNGRLLLFEADVAMIVHSMDSEAVFPYKKKAMSTLFSAFDNTLAQRVARANSTSGVKVAHTGKAPIFQRTDDDCLICVLAMYTGKSYDEIEEIATSCEPSFPSGGPMSHSIMRAVANTCGIVLLSSIYMLWNKPAIIGVVSPTVPDTGHAVLWDGEKIIDPGIGDRVDRSYVDRCGLEFSQRATDLAPLITHEAQISYKAGAVSIVEPL